MRHIAGQQATSISIVTCTQRWAHYCILRLSQQQWVSQVASPALHPKKLFEKSILRQPAGHASHRWPTSNLYFYSNMLPAVGPQLHLDIISAAMGVAGCIANFSRSKDGSSFSKRWNRDPWHDIEIYLMKQVSVRSSWQSIVSSCTNMKTCVHHQGCRK